MADLAKDPFGLDRQWRAATNRILKMMDDGIATDGLPIGPGSHLGVERYSREVVAANPQSDLGIMYGLTSVATCVAAQGAYVLQAPIAGGGWLKIPAIQYLIGIAPSGWGKSTALNVAKDPLDRALAAGEKQRRAQLPREKDLTERDALPQLPVGKELDPKQFAEIFNGGVCPVTIVRDPTVEGLRNMLVGNGAVAAVLAGEADVFRNVSAYSSDSGSLTFFLDGWEQESIATVRAGTGLLAIDDAALIMGVLFQTDVFAEVTSGNSARGGVAGGADSYQQRGMFGRFWVVETTSTGGWEDIAKAYADDTVWDQHEGPDGMSDRYGEASLLGLAYADYGHNLMTLVSDSNQYRMNKALRHSWLEASKKYGNELQCPEIEPPERTVIKLDSPALVAYSRVQRMQAALKAHLADADPDIQALWEPMASRFTGHVLREALVVSLGAGRRVVTAEIIEDAALRLIPWRWGLSTRALVKRNEERLDNIIADSFSVNPRQVDVTAEARAVAILAKLFATGGEGVREGWTTRDISRKFCSSFPKSQRRGMGPRCVSALETLAQDPQSGITRVPGPPDARDHPTWRYLISPMTVASQAR